tara:strand:- start:13400 stop:14956 length:1557 start_codon:yes stop_codon:yes gene_type:complete
MAAIITDQLRILSAKNFVSGVQTSTNSYYGFIGLPNATAYQSTWDSDPPSPLDSLDQTNQVWDTMLSVKKINSSDATQVVNKNVWASGTTYDMWRNDITIDNLSQPSGSSNIYSANYYVMNSDYRVYICLFNSATPENAFRGGPSLDEPTFTDLEPRAAGSSGDGYIWKYLYTIKPSQAIKFDSTNYIPVPSNWSTSSDNASVRQNASASGQIKIVSIKERGVGLGTAQSYSNVPINGDGNGATATVVVNSDSKIDSVTISNGGSNYTFGTLDLVAGGLPVGTTNPIFNVIVPPPGGHGSDIYRELGAFNVLLYARFENDSENPDFVTGNQFARIGLIENPKKYETDSIFTDDKGSAVYALRLTGTGYSSANFTADSLVTQTVGLGSTAVGRVVSYNQTTGVLKYWQDRSNSGLNTDGTQNASPTYGFTAERFSADIITGGSYNIIPSSGNTLSIETSFTGISTTINNRDFNLGQNFSRGISNPELEKYSGNIIHVDNRPSITRSASQKEDVKIILQF